MLHRLITIILLAAASLAPRAHADCITDTEITGSYFTAVRDNGGGSFTVAAVVSVPVVPGATRYSLDATGGNDPYFYGNRIRKSGPPFAQEHLWEERGADEHWFILSGVSGGDPAGAVAYMDSRFGSGWEWKVTLTLPVPRVGILASPSERPVGGERFEIRVDVSNESDEELTDVHVSGGLQIEPDGIVALASVPFPSSFSLAPGESGTFVYELIPLAEGTATIDAVVEATADGATVCSTTAACDPSPTGDEPPGASCGAGNGAEVMVFALVEPEPIDVELHAFNADGEPIDGDLSLEQDVHVELTITNTSAETLDRFGFAGGQPLVVDERSTGGVEILYGPDPAIDAASFTLAAAEAITLRYRMTTTARGIAAAHSRVTALDTADVLYEGAHSLRFDIEDGEPVTEALGNWLIMQALDQLLLRSFRSFYEGMQERAERLRGRLEALFSPEDMLAWFGSLTEFELDDRDHALASLRPSSPKMVDAHLPNGGFRGHSYEEMTEAYNKTLKRELGKGVAQWAEGWANLGRRAKRTAKRAYREALLSSYYFAGTATSHERGEFEAKMTHFANLNDSAFGNLFNTVKSEVPQWRANGTYLWEAIEMSALDVTLQAPDIQAQIAQERRWRDALIRSADENPLRFQRAWAKRDAEIINTAMPLVLDTFFGGIATRGIGAANVTIGGRGASVVNAGKAAGVLDESGALVRGRRTGIARADDGVANGIRGINTARTSEELISNLDGATIVRSSDAGNVYELPNLGGVPEITLDAKAAILVELEAEYVAATGSSIQLAEVLKPSSALRKPGGVAKLELTAQKTGKPSMLDAGMPGDALGEASVWRNVQHPRSRPEWRWMSRARRKAALDEWNTANQRWAEWENPPPGSKTARLKQCVGQRSRVPLDLEPNQAGLQRFVTAEFEEVLVSEGTAEARLIRVKHYEVEVVDTNSGVTVNRKTVVSSAEALPQTPDADAVALAKVVGTDGGGRPIVEPLSRAEREFVMQRYIDKNIKARKTGVIPDAAEHGVTLIMDDASAQAAGKLLPSYGVPFLPEEIGTAYLRRIAPFVKPANLTTEQMVEKMIKLVQSEGGFGQRAVVVTSDSRYLGEVPFASW